MDRRNSYRSEEGLMLASEDEQIGVHYAEINRSIYTKGTIKAAVLWLLVSADLADLFI